MCEMCHKNIEKFDDIMLFNPFCTVVRNHFSTSMNILKIGILGISYINEFLYCRPKNRTLEIKHSLRDIKQFSDYISYGDYST